MDQVTEFFERLFSADSWPARWHCGVWTDFHGWLYIFSDVAIWAAYFVIPFFLIQYLKKKPNIPLSGVFWLFGAFILFCGLTHLMDAIIFWWPNYRLSALIRFMTAVISWITVVAIYKFFPIALALKTSKEFEAELSARKKSESKFMILLESAPDAMVIADKNGKIIMINAQTEKLFGFKSEELIGNEIELLIPDRFHQKHVIHRMEFNKNAKARGMGIGMDLYGKQKDGKEFPVEISLSPVKTDQEDDIMIIAAIRDISRNKEIESEIKKLNENLEQLVTERTAELELALQNEKSARSEMAENQLRLSFLTEASEVLASSLDYSKTLLNMAGLITPKIADWCTIDEVEEDGSIKRLVVSHVDPEKIKFAYELEQKYPSDPNSPNGVHQVIRTRKAELYPIIPDEMIVAAAQNEEHLKIMRDLGLKSAIIVPLIIRDKIYGVLTLVLSESGRLFNESDLEFTREIARHASLAIENAKHYKELQEMNVELELRVAKRTSELEVINKELEAFSYSVSHDLRAPLRSIDGFSNKILKEYGGLFDEQGKNYFMRVKNASQQMGYLIDDLLKLAKLSSIEMYMEITNLSAIAESIVSELKASNPERKANILIQKEIIAKVDRNLMQIALQNLLSNAWKYSKNQTETTIEFGTFLKDEQTVYFIKDNGVGFNMKYVDKLFGAFQRLHSISEFEGIGIGLATVKRIIHRHLGTIWVKGEVNKGATFFFTLKN
jgi:PAS domain S-box-containing protein